MGVKLGFLQKKFSVKKNICEQMSKIYIKNMVDKYYFQQRSMEINRTRRYKFINTKKKI